MKIFWLNPQSFMSLHWNPMQPKLWCFEMLKTYSKQSVWIERFNPGLLKRHDCFTMNGFHLGLYSHKYTDYCTYIELIKYGTTCFTCNNRSTWLLARHERTNLICSHAQAHLSSKAIMSLPKTLIKQLESYDYIHYILNFGYLNFF